MKKKSLLLLALTVVLVLSAVIQPALAYFTTYAQARGTHTISLGDTRIEENFYSWTKHITISNEEDGWPVYVRARAYAGDAYPLEYASAKLTDENGNEYDCWVLGNDGYYYYTEILQPGMSTLVDGLEVAIKDIPEDALPGDNFNVAVIYETTPVVYDGLTPLDPVVRNDNGVPTTPYYAAWDKAQEGGAES